MNQPPQETHHEPSAPGTGTASVKGDNNGVNVGTNTGTINVINPS